jgi:hypothetical protein
MPGNTTNTRPIESDLIATFSVVFDFTSFLGNHARASSQGGKMELDGNYRRLNGLGFCDLFGRNSRGPNLIPRNDFESVDSNTCIRALTSGTAGLKYREIPTNLSLVKFDEADDPDL